MATLAQRILYITQYFPPEVNAPAVRVSEFARDWSSAGRHISILTGFPNHPNGVIAPGDRGQWYRHENSDGVDIHRTWLFASPNAGIVKRSFSFLTFMVSAIVTGVLRIRRIDVVIASSPQLLVAFAGWVISIAKRVPFIFEVRDVWPEEIVAVGAIRNHALIRMLERLEEFLYRRAARIVCVAKGTMDILTSRGVPQQKLVYIPNGVTPENFGRIAPTGSIRDQYGLNGQFMVSYIGTVGMAHHLEVLLDAAARLRHRRDIHFMVVGNGARRRELETKSQEMSLANVTWVNQQPRNRIAQYYSAADSCLVHLRRADLFTKNVPSKIYEIMASGRPIILGTHGESRELVTRAGCGVCFEPENGEDLARQIEKLAGDHRLCREMGDSGRVFVRQYYDRGIWASRYLKLLDSMCQSSTVADATHAVSVPK